MKIDDRIRKLEQQVNVPPFEHGSSRIAWECFTERERLVFNKILEIEKEYGEKPPSDVLTEHMHLLQAAVKIMWIRTMDLFQTIMDAVYFKEDNFERWIFWSRFAAFFNTSIEIVKMHRIEHDFYKKFEEQYGEGWPKILQEKYGDDWPQPDYNGIGERDFNKELKKYFRVKK